MEFKKTPFILNADCPVCKQGDSLVFVLCNNCNRIMLECAEEGSIFPDPTNLSRPLPGPIQNPNASCMYCNNHLSTNLAGSQQIQDAGFGSFDFH